MTLEITVPTMGTIRTIDVLRGLGFQSDSTVTSDEGPGLSFDFGGIRLRAGAYRKWLAEIVLITGVLATSRSFAQIHFEMPRYVDSAHFVTAWIVWHLDQHSEFRKVQNLSWVEDGRNHQGLLPWVKSMAEWGARPQCTVDRDWLRLALKTLADYALILPDDACVLFTFDGSVFASKCDGKVIALACEGASWGVSFKAQVGALRRLPKRLMREDIGISIWESSISIGNRAYPGTLDGFGAADQSKIQ
jgi:hypothetical protein